MLKMRSHIVSSNFFKSLNRTSYQLIKTNNSASHSSHSILLNGSRTVQRSVLFGGSSHKERTSPLTRHNAAQSSYSTPACTTKYSHPSCIHRSYSANILANSVARKSLIPHTAPCERLLWQPPCRSFLSAISTNGFNDYEIGKRDFKIDVPEYFNFAADVMDEWAKKEETGKRTSNVPAFWWVDTEGNELKWSFRDLQVKSKKVANLLSSACDIKPGDRVMVILPRIPEWWLVNLACMRTGAVLLPGTTQLRTGDIRERVQKSGSVCIITNEDMAPLVDEACVDCESLQRKVLVSDKDKQGTERSGWLDFNALFEEASEEHECVQTRSDDPMTIFFTSGTTGKPKMAEHTHASYGLGHIITGKLWLDLGSTDILWNMSDTGWAKAAYSNIYAPWLQGSCVFVELSPKFDALRTLQVLSDYPITVFCAPPTAFTLMAQEDVSKYKLRSVRDFMGGGEHLNPEVNYAWKKATGNYIREGFGQTETTLSIGTFKCINVKPGSCGKAAPGYDVAIIDDEGNELPRGMEGNIGIRVKPERPVGLFTRYVDEPERTASVFRGDFYLTGDRASMDEEGYIWMTGRSDDIISSAGYRIGPFEVESALLEHPAVAEAAAVSSPDKTRGEVVKAFIVLSEGFKGADQESLIKQIQEHVKNTTAPYKYPRKVEFVDSLPKTISNKVRRVELREREWKSVLQQNK